jgi:hypothetical protein
MRRVLGGAILALAAIGVFTALVVVGSVLVVAEHIRHWAAQPPR